MNIWQSDDVLNKEMLTIIEALKQTVIGPCTIALAGSNASGTADEHSDVDIYMYMKQAAPYEKRIAIVESLADANKSFYVSPDGTDAPWGGSMNFYYQGTLVEITCKRYDKAQRYIDDALEGRFEVIPADWTIAGYYTYAYLCETSYLVPLWDPMDFIAHNRARIYPYAPKLKKAIYEHFITDLFWLEDFEYLHALEREDVFYISAFNLRRLMAMVQIIFTLNDRYYTGDKKIFRTLRTMNYCPPKLLDNIEFLLSAPQNVNLLKKQRALLCEIRDELHAKIIETSK